MRSAARAVEVRAQDAAPSVAAPPARTPTRSAGLPEAEPRLAHDFGRVRVFDNQGGGTPPAMSTPAPQPAQSSGAGTGSQCPTPGDLRNVDLQPVALRTNASDTSPTGGSWTRRFLSAARIWSKLGVYFRGMATVTVDTPLKTASGAAVTELNSIRALRDDTGIEVFMVDNDMSARGGGNTSLRGSGSAKIVMSDRGTSDTLLAHEIGHALGLGHPPGDADAGTIMDPSGSNSTANPTKNTMANYNRITWPAPNGSTCLSPDP